MATDFSTFMFAYSQNELSITGPITESSLYNGSGIIDVLLRKLEEGTVLEGLSRNNWLHNKIKAFYFSHKIECLKFLTHDCTSLSPEQTRKIANEFEFIFQNHQGASDGIFDILENKIPAAEIIRTIESAKPNFHPTSGGDGDDMAYLLAYLISVKALLQDAAEKGLCIFYFQPQLMAENSMNN